MLRTVPQVVVGIDNGEVGIEDGLGRLPGQPRLIRRGDLAKSGRLLGRRSCAYSLVPYKAQGVQWFHASHRMCHLQNTTR